MTTMTERYLELQEEVPSATPEDLLENLFLSDAPRLTEGQVLYERQQLDKLESFIGQFEVAKTLMDVAPDALAIAVAKITAEHEANPTLAWSAANPERTEEMNYRNPQNDDYEESVAASEPWGSEIDEDEIDPDMKEVLELAAYAQASGDEEAIDALMEKFGKRRRKALHHTRVSDSRSPLQKSHRSFQRIANEPMRVFKALTREGHEFISDDEADLSVTNEGALNVLRSAAAKTLQTRGNSNQEDVTNMTTPEVPSLRLADVDTKKALASWESVKLTPTVDQSWTAIAKRTAAAKTIERPSKIDFKDQSRNQDGNVPANQTYVQAAQAASQMSGEDSYSDQGQDQSRQQPYDVEERNLASRRSSKTKPLSNR